MKKGRSFCAAYYHLGDKERLILDFLIATEGTTISYKMMATVVSYVKMLETIVDHHDAGDYEEGRVSGLLHTINYSNTHKNFVVLVSNSCYLPN